MKKMCGLVIWGSVIAAGAFDVVRDGRPMAAIVTAERPSPLVRYAAEELQRHIERSSACRLEIITEDQENRFPHAVYVGDGRAVRSAGIDVSKQRKNEFTRKTTSGALFLAGRDDGGTPPRNDFDSQGTLLAVYNWLDTELGVRWLWPGEVGVFVPRRATVGSGGEGEFKWHPPLLHTRLRDTRLGHEFRVVSDAEMETGLNERAAWMRRHGILREKSLDYGHAYTKYWERFGAAHPEYFALRPDGKRAPVDERISLVQMCVSNPGFHQQVIADWLERRQSKPELEWINGCENDKRAIDPFCGCPECKKMDASAGKRQTVSENSSSGGSPAGYDGNSYSDRYARFWLALQTEGRKHDPDATVIGYAYADYSEPPQETELNPNIIVGIVPKFTYPLTAGKRDVFRKQWDGWAKSGARLYLRPNYLLFGYCMPYIFARELGEDLRYSREHGLIGTDFDSLTSMWAVQGPNLYMAGRMQAHPDMKTDEVLNEYYGGFGPAAADVKRYFEHWETVTRRRDAKFEGENKQGGWNNIGWCAHKIFTPDTLVEGSRILARAEKAAANDPDAAAKVAFLRKGFKHTELTLDAMNAYHAWKAESKNKDLRKTFTECLEKLDEYRAAIRNDHVVNPTLLRKLEAWNGWRSGRPPQNQP
jgi:hypothetical protein